MNNLRGKRSLFCYTPDNKKYYKGLNNLLYYLLIIKNKLCGKGE